MIAGGIRLPNSCVKVLDVLTSSSCSEGISQQQIINETGLSERAVKYALKRLVTAKTVREFSIIGDLRRKIYVKGD